MPYEIIKADVFLEKDDDIIINKRFVEGHRNIHAHEFIEIAYVANGEGTHIVSGEKDVISKGDLFLIDANVTHEFTANPDTPFTIYNCIFQPPAVDSCFEPHGDFVDVAYNYLLHSLNHEKTSPGYIKLVGIKSNMIENLLETMYFEYTSKDNGFRQVMKSTLNILLVIIFRLYKNDMNQKNNKSIYKTLLVKNAMEFLKEHYSEDIRLNKISQRAYLSPTYFSRIFKEESGITFVQALQNIRINVACDLLINTNLTVADVAIKSGYSDIKYFYELFHRIKKFTPGEYRTLSK